MSPEDVGTPAEELLRRTVEKLMNRAIRSEEYNRSMGLKLEEKRFCGEGDAYSNVITIIETLFALKETENFYE